MTDSYVQRQVRRFRKTWNQAASDKEEAKERKIWGSSKGDGKAGAGKSKSRDLRRGPDEDYTAPLMVVAQPLRVLADSIDRASSPAHQLVTRDGRSRRRGASEAEPFVPPSVPVMLGVNADEGLMFVHGAFPLTMPKVLFPAVSVFVLCARVCVVLMEMVLMEMVLMEVVPLSFDPVDDFCCF